MTYLEGCLYREGEKFLVNRLITMRYVRLFSVFIFYVKNTQSDPFNCQVLMPQRLQLSYAFPTLFIKIVKNK